MIQQRRSDLKRVRHAHAVHLYQDILRKIGLKIDILDSRKMVFDSLIS